ncbi:MAG: hypothetical protein HYU63_03810, partial [Armatimonadetes bacterium]|nr:hypothetical protein [Armatimonadota bacterium]
MTNELLQQSFSIYAKPRPKRVAFFIDPNNSSEELLDAIFDFNLSVWGGRYNPIIPICNKNVSDDYWQLLKFCDPDIIYSYAEVSEDLIEKIDRCISPLHFTLHNNRSGNNYRVSIIDNINVNIEYFFNQIKKRKTSLIYEPSFLVCHNDERWEHYRFVQRNFGLYNDEILSNMLPPNINKVEISRDSESKTFFKAIYRAARIQSKEIIFPIRLAEYETNFKNSADFSNDDFCIIAGDNVWDWLYFWNRIFLLSPWKRSRLSQVCIPVKFFESDEVVESMGHFLFTQIESSGQLTIVNIKSHCIDKDELNDLANKIKNFGGAHVIIEKLEANKFLKITPRETQFKSQPSTYH